MSAAACAVPVAPAESKETDEHVASGAQAILNGSPVDPEKIGVVVVNTPGGGCSGALLNNQWVITAKHCTDGLTAPWQIQVLLGAHSSYGLKYYRHPDQFTDVAIIELEWPLAMQGKTTGYSRPLSTTPIDQFKDSPVFCYGYGLPNFPTLRGAIMAVGGAGTSSFQLLPWSSSNPSLLVEGDSGGICTGWDGSIVGIQSLVFQLSPTNEWDQQARADAVASWVSFKMNGGIIVCPPAICGG